MISAKAVADIGFTYRKIWEIVINKEKIKPRSCFIGFIKMGKDPFIAL